MRSGGQLARVLRVDHPAKTWTLCTRNEQQLGAVYLRQYSFFESFCNELLLDVELAFGMAIHTSRSTWLVCSTLSYLFSSLAQAVSPDKAEQQASYAPGDAIPVSCLNRTV